MSQVFISYRQTDDEQKRRVRAFAERLRRSGIDVVLDQFLLDDKPEGPDEGWDKWSSDRALNTQYVLIVGTLDWFQCFEKTRPRGSGLGSACEADDIRYRIYEAGGIIDNIRVVLFDDADAAYIPAKLRGYHRFHAENDFANIVRWLGGAVPVPWLKPFLKRKKGLHKNAEDVDAASRSGPTRISSPSAPRETGRAANVLDPVDISPPRGTVFLSYARGDQKENNWKDRLDIQLRAIARFRDLQVWHDGLIAAGADWRQEIRNALKSSRVAILLIGPHFLTSEFIAKQELPVLLGDANSVGVRILPVITDFCPYSLSPLGRFQSVNDPKQPLESLSRSDQNRILADVAERVAALFE